MDKDLGQFMYSASIGGIGTCKGRGVYIVLGYVTNIERVLFLLEKAPRYMINGDPKNGYVGECPVCGCAQNDVLIYCWHKALNFKQQGTQGRRNGGHFFLYISYIKC